MLLSSTVSVLNAQVLQIKRSTSIETRSNSGQHFLVIARNGDIVTVSSQASGPYPATHINYVITRMDTQHKTIWQKFYHTSSYVVREPSDIINTNDNGFLVTGTATDLAGLNPDKTELVKIDSEGNIQWSKMFGGSGKSFGVSTEQSLDGGYMVLSNTLESFRGDIVSSSKLTQIWIAKIDSGGILQWTKLLTNTLMHTANNLAKSKDGSFVLCGLLSSITGSLGPGRSWADGILMKFDEQGKILWNQYPGGYGYDYCAKVITDNDGNIYTAGYSSSNLSPNLGGKEISMGWVIKHNATGDRLWERYVGGSKGDRLTSIALLNDGSIVAGGQAFSTDGDLSTNLYNHTLWVVKFIGQNGPLESVTFGQTYNPYFSITDIAVQSGGDISFVSSSDSSNPYLIKPVGIEDMWLVTLGISNRIVTTAYFDINSNGKQDAGEGNINGRIELRNVTTNQQRTILSSRAGLLTYVDAGNYSVKFLTDENYYVVTPENFALNYTTTGNIDTLSFRLLPKPEKNDLAIDLVPIEPSRPGFERNYHLKYYNKGTSSINMTVLKLALDKSMNILSTVPAFNHKIGDTLVWRFQNILPFDSLTISVHGRLNAPPLIALGDTLRSFAMIAANVKDETPADNYINLFEIVQGAFDPNDKQEFHGGKLPIGSIGGDNLAYLIRFQNTGTDTAFNVVVIDTLDSNLNWQTFKMRSASHNYTLTIKNNNILEWKFDGIRLPDSNRNEPASHGYIRFNIAAKSNLQLGTKLKNDASIYFDFNLPIVTNEAVTEIVPNPITLTTGIIDIQYPLVPIVIFPNPFYQQFTIKGLQSSKIYQVQIIDVSGTVHYLKIVKNKTEETFTNIDLTTGQYLIRLIDHKKGKVVGTGKLIRN